MAESSSSSTQSAAKSAALLLGGATLGLVGLKACEYYTKNQTSGRPRGRSNSEGDANRNLSNRKRSASGGREQLEKKDDLWRKAAEGMPSPSGSQNETVTRTDLDSVTAEEFHYMLQVLVQNQETTRRIFFEYLTAKRKTLKKEGVGGTFEDLQANANTSSTTSTSGIKPDPWARYDRAALRQKEFLKVFQEDADKGIDGVSNVFNPKKQPLQDDSIFNPKTDGEGHYFARQQDSIPEPSSPRHVNHIYHISALMEHNFGGVWGPSDFLRNHSENHNDDIGADDDGAEDDAHRRSRVANVDATSHIISPEQFSFLLKKFRDVQEIRERVLDLVAVRNWKFPPGADAPLSVEETMEATKLLCTEMERKVLFWKKNQGESCQRYFGEVIGEFLESDLRKNRESFGRAKTCTIDNLTTLGNVILLREKAEVFVQLEGNTKSRGTSSSGDSVTKNENSASSISANSYTATSLEGYEFSCQKHGLSLVSHAGFAMCTAKLRHLEGELQKYIRKRVVEIEPPEKKRMGLKRD